MSHRGYRKASRDHDWGQDEDRSLTIEQINCGSLMRIADATELMAKEYQRLLDRAKWLEARAVRAEGETQRLARSNAALRGHLKRIKKGIQ